LFPYVISVIIGYFLGSFPTAYLLVKRKSRLDLRTIGGGNVGARNTYDVTGSKALGSIVLVTDLIKGFISVWLCSFIFGKEFWIMSVAGISAIVGHNYSVWIRFKGGRGLATSAGICLLLGWIFIPVWIILWFTFNSTMKNIHIANILASIFASIAIWIMPENLIDIFLPWYTPVLGYRYLVVLISLLILLSHIQPILEIIRTSHYSNQSK
jgi:acyl phosphate:glycerol-3-phosphate acyltransferase